MKPEKMIANALEKGLKIAYKAGGEAVRQAFAHDAGRLLSKGEGSVMKTFNEVGRALKKM